MFNNKSDNGLIMFVNLLGVGVAYGMLGISLWLSTDVPLIKPIMRILFWSDHGQAINAFIATNHDHHRPLTESSDRAGVDFKLIVALPLTDCQQGNAKGIAQIEFNDGLLIKAFRDTQFYDAVVWVQLKAV